MINPASVMKLMNLKNRFSETHPKFVAFCSNVLGNGVEEGTVVELTVTKPGERPVTTNIKVRESDIELLNELKGLSGKQ